MAVDFGSISSIIVTALKVMKALDDYAKTVKDAPKSCESLKVDLSSTHKVLAEMDCLIKEGGEVCRFDLQAPRYEKLISD